MKGFHSLIVRCQNSRIVPQNINLGVLAWSTITVHFHKKSPHSLQSPQCLFYKRVCSSQASSSMATNSTSRTPTTANQVGSGGL